MLKAKTIKQSETFNDGVLNVCQSKDGVIIENKANSIRFGNKTYGVQRFFKAEASGNQIDRMIATPFNDFINREDILELTDFKDNVKKLYEIVMIQKIFDSAPKSLLITLKKTSINYVDRRNNQTD